MTEVNPICNHVCVQMRPVLVVVLCMLLVTVRSMGMHAHVIQESEGDSDHVHESQILGAITQSDSEHLALHLSHGGIDLDSMAKAVGKDPLSKVVIVPVALAFLLAIIAFCPSLRINRPPRRPPKRPHGFYLTPPSHAPPVQHLND